MKPGGGTIATDILMTEKSSTQLYDERAQRIADAVALKETDRVPFVYSTRFWAARAFGISCQEQMYDADKAAAVTKRAITMLQPDAFVPSLLAFGPTLEALDYKPMKWPGHGTNPNVTFQYLDKEFVTASEYDEYIADPSIFYIRKYLPRIASAYEGLQFFPDFAALSEWRLIGNMRAFANPKLRDSLRQLIEVGERAEYASKKTISFVEEMKALGFPIVAGSFCKAPYDHIADFMRGSKGAMLDMFRHKDKLLAAIETAGKVLIRGVVEEAQAIGHPYVSMPLHWGLDGFMSPVQFNTFYWPALRKIVLHLIENGLVPVLMWEGTCTSRLETIGDIPRGKAVYWFERTDMFKAKEILGDVVCLRGNVPSSLLNTGTPDEVDEYCKQLIQKVGKGGGLILDGAASIPDEAKSENVKAMAESARKYAN
jgi:uroporphyrinogen-III decarboxylase